MVKRLQTKYKNAKVYFRILPMVKMCWEHVKILDDKKTIFLRCLQDFEIGREMCKPSYWHFATDGVFYNNSQLEIYDAVMTDVLNSVLEGNNAIILGYGQTGTGKSLTMSGAENCYADRGIIPRLITDLFTIKNNMQGKCKIRYQMSYAETTKMYIYDLLKDDDNMFDMNSIKNISIVAIDNEDQALKMIFQGKDYEGKFKNYLPIYEEKERAEGRKSTVKESPYNSHAASSVLTITITSKPVQQSEHRKMISKIHIVDLAGADTIGNLSCFYKNVFEIGSANLAKSQLEQFLLILVENIPEHILINQRLSILIRFLRDSLNASSLLRFIGHIRTNKEDLRITISMLRFGQIVRGLKAKRSEPDLHENEDVKVQTLENEIVELKKRKDLDAMLVDHDLGTNITQERVLHVQHVAEEYLHDKVSDLVFFNVADVQIVFQVFKSMYNSLEVQRDEAEKKAYEEVMHGTKSTSRKESVASSRQSRKGYSKSKESYISGQASKSIGRRSLSKQSSVSDRKERSKKSLSEMQDTTAESDRSLRRNRTSSKMLKSSSRSKRKLSISSVDKIVEEGKDVPIPDLVPEHEEAWNLFTQDTNYQYEEMKTELDTDEVKVKAGHGEYLKEVKKLQSLRGLFDKAHDDLMRAQMQRDLSRKDEFDETGNMIFTAEELAFTEILKETEKELVTQQEKVLALQAELRLYLQLHQDVKKNITDKFESFCYDKFKTLVPNLQDTPTSIETPPVYSLVPNPSVDEDPSHQGTEVTVKVSEQYNALMKYESLKNVMNKQKEKRVQKEILSKKWIQSCKN